MTSNLKNRIVILAFINFVLMPLIFFWQLLYCFFNYADLIKREPGSLGVRKWSQYGKLYLRHLNELDHEFKSRLNRAYKPANQYMEIFVSPMRYVTIYITLFTFLFKISYNTLLFSISVPLSPDSLHSYLEVYWQCSFCCLYGTRM